MMDTVSLENSISYATKHWGDFLEEFKQFLRIPSVSGDPAFRSDVRRTAEWISAEMNRVGLHNCQLLEGTGHPAVYGEWLEAGPDKPTVLMYAHYDTQPVDPLELWVTPPFEPSERDGWLYARGAVDDKCGVFGHLMAVKSYLAATGRLPINVKFIFEGEEESGSPSMAALIHKNKSLLQADLLVVSDGGCVDDQPYVIASTRGIVTTEVTIHGPNHDLHSGRYGGIVCNPAHVAAEIITAVHDEDGRIQIPGFYDYDQRLPSNVLAYYARLEEDLVEEASQETGLEYFWGVKDFSFIERQTVLPTFDINGLYGGYQDAGTKTIIPAAAGFKASMRLAAGQDPEDIAEKVARFVKKFEKPDIRIEISTMGEGRAVEWLTDGAVVEALQNVYRHTYGKPAILYRQGGSVPVLGTFQHVLGIPMVNLGFGNGINHHAPNERVSIHYLKLDLDTAIHFYYRLGELDRFEFSQSPQASCIQN